MQTILDVEIEKRRKIEFHYLPDGKVLSFLLKDFSALASDIYWIKTVLYFGRNNFDEDYPFQIPEFFSKGKKSLKPVDWETKSRRLKLLKPLLDLVVTLDPHFYYPYLFGGLFLSMKAGKFEESIDILRRGEKVFPQDWRFPLWIGFNYFFYLGDTKSALYEFLKSAGMEGCPGYVMNLATGVAKKSGKKELAVVFLEGARESAQSEVEKEQLNSLLKKLKEE